jgi:hypothetical protein
MRGFGPFSAIAPVLEVHFNTPLNHRSDSGDFIRFSDMIQVTAGTYFQLGERALLGVAAGAPVTGPNLFDWGAMASFNWRF